MSVPAPRERYSPPNVPAPAVSPKSVAWRAVAPGTSILIGMSCLVMCMMPSVVVRGAHCPRRACNAVQRPGTDTNPIAKEMLRRRACDRPDHRSGRSQPRVPSSGCSTSSLQRICPVITVGSARASRTVASAKSSALAQSSSPWYGDEVPGRQHRLRRQQRVHRDVVGRHLERHRLGEVVHGGLVAAVREAGGVPGRSYGPSPGHERGERADVDDPAPAELDHVGQHELHEPVAGEQADLEVEAVPLQREVEERTRRASTSSGPEAAARRGAGGAGDGVSRTADARAR